jgi:hypothetical protein
MERDGIDSSRSRLLSSQLQCAWPAHAIVQQLELHPRADVEITDGGAFLQVGTMEVHFAFVRQANEPMALTDEKPHNPASRRRSSPLEQAWFRCRPPRRPLSAKNVRLPH